MSRNPSPAPQHPSAPEQCSKHKSFNPIAITSGAGADDFKYQAKYKELKRKVKDIETDNDKLHIKVLNARLTIQRMKMERAILYERLSQPHNSPLLQDRGSLPLPSSTSGGPPHQASAAHHPRDSRDHSASAEPDQPNPGYQEYNPRTRGPPDHPPPPEGRPVSVIDKPGVAHSPHMQLSRSPQRPPAEQDGRQRIPLSRQLPSMQDSYPPRSSHASPPRDRDYPPPSHVRTRSQSSSRSRSHQVQNQTYRDSQYPEPMQPQGFSPPLSERERSRQSDMRSMPTSQGEPHGRPHHSSLAPLSPRSSTSDLRARVHPHQRMGPGTYINRDAEYSERHRDLDRDRDWEQHERERPPNREMPASMYSPHSAPRNRAPIERPDYPDHHMTPREEHPPPHAYEAPPPRPYLVPRSDTPGSASASGSGAGGPNDDSSRPDSRTQYYEHDRAGRAGSFRLRPVIQPGPSEDSIGFVHEDGRSRTTATSGGGNYPETEQAHESRKRSRNDMDVDGEDDVGAPPGLYSTGRLQDDRGSKRYQRERQSRRSIDANEESRAGSS
ncbi:hypothetical protein FA13DRAFT_1811414 [Coprinellus micaceus]|uniref:INO80 complex subunit F domain-containing protein n=1 Tax=Coprinellus micaceus TaxID=71717 RepID=A0A4Y7TP51_COPMI|nr:hypothetical protein FA13DRAFT_1811414 [Coprinellus micaceus]